MRPEPFEEVEIIRDDAAQHLTAGQRGHLVEWIGHPHGGEDGAVIELVGVPDRDDPVVIVPQSGVRAVCESSSGAGNHPHKRAS
jgi:hypothetical protein